MLISILSAIIVAALFYYYIIRAYDYWKDRGVKQGKPVWILGDSWKNVLQLESFTEMIHSAYNQFPDTRYSGIYQFLLPTLVVKDPDLLKQLTVKDFDHFTDHRNFVPEDVDPLGAKNLFGLKGQKWREMRTILSPSFTSSKMKTMFGLMVESAEHFVQHFLNEDKAIITMEMKDTFTRLTNDVIATCAFGVRVDSLGEPNNKFYVRGREATDLSGLKNLKFLGYILFPRFLRLLKVKLFEEEFYTFFRDIINQTIKSREEKGIVRPDMINLLLEARKGVHKHDENGIIDTGFATAQEEPHIAEVKVDNRMTNEDIAAQALIFFFAGFDAVSTLMCFMSHELALNPDIQERLRKEVRDTFEECKGKITYEGLLKMKYLDMVISESLRKWPSAVAVDRMCTKPYTIEPVLPGEKPLHLEKGVLFFLPIYGMHHDPKHFPNPERFDPERFSDENKDNIKPYTYFPFGLGPRNCIGSRFALLETKVIFFHILLHFQFVTVEKTQIPLKITKKSFNIGAEKGFWLGLKRIKS